MWNSDPWENISPSQAGYSIIGHLVLESRPHQVFLARDASRRRVLFLVHNPASMPSTSLPRMAGLEVDVEMRKEDGQAMLSIRLENQDDTDVFARLCHDIVMTVSNARDEISAVQAFLGRTWKWHALLKAARKKTLTREEQLGLIGELRTMSETIHLVKGLGAALEAWRGSEGAPKDFELAGLCIECKARGASSRDKVRISSEHQLADVPGQELVLLVHTFATADKDAVEAINLHNLVSSIRSKISSERPDLTSMLEEKLEEAGYNNDHDYDVVVVHRSTESYSVIEGFPRIVPGNYQEGPTEVSYDLPLAQITPFMIGSDELVRLIANLE